MKKNLLAITFILLFAVISGCKKDKQPVMENPLFTWKDSIEGLYSLSGTLHSTGIGQNPDGTYYFFDTTFTISDTFEVNVINKDSIAISESSTSPSDISYALIKDTSLYVQYFHPYYNPGFGDWVTFWDSVNDSISYISTKQSMTHNSERYLYGKRLP